ncbi:MAG: hypothetical protein ACHQIM_12735 [Sphingobacteriales bacterium]
MITLFRAVSQQEKEDYDTHLAFRTGRNTLEAKQFFKTRMAVTSFIDSSMEQNYDPACAHLMIVTVDDDHFDIIQRTTKLDGYDAVHIDEDDLPDFNKCVIFVKQEVL